MRFRFRLQMVLALLMAPLCLLPIPGCGGSTSGTGGVTVSGRVIDTAGTPLSDATITALQSGEIVISDQNGDFQLETEFSESIEFLIEKEEFSARSTIGNLPPTTATLEVLFTVDRNKGSVNGETIAIEERGRGESSRSSSSKSSNGSEDKPEPSFSSQSSSSSSASSESSEHSEDDHGSEDDSNESSSSQSSSSDDEDSNEERKAEGRISALTSGSVTVQAITFFATAQTEYRDRNGKSSTLGSFSVGEDVNAKGTVRSGVLELDRLESED